MTDDDLVSILRSIDMPTHGILQESFLVRKIPGYNEHYIGFNKQRQPCLLLGSKTGKFYAPMRLALIDANFGSKHSIRLPDRETREEILSTVTCTSDDVEVQEYFLQLCTTITRIIGTAPTLHKVVTVVQRLIDLFRKRSRPPARALNGLLGELTVIAASRNLQNSLRAWRNNDSDRFDFSIDDTRIDVKASSSRLREHHITLEQCTPPQGTAAILASLFIENNGGGQSLRELLSAIKSNLNGEDDLIFKLEETVSATLGEGIMSAMDTRFDDRLARSSLRFYNALTIPAIRNDIPVEVSAVRFCSDLAGTIFLTTADIADISVKALDFVPADYAACQ